MMNRPEAIYLLELLDERLLLAHSIFDFDVKMDGPEAHDRYMRSLERHFFVMVCMQRKNYQPLTLRNLLDKEWRRRFLPELHDLMEGQRAKLTEEMVERGANAVLRLATEGHHSKELVVRNGRAWFSLKNDPDSILNNVPNVTYARFSSKISPTDLLKTTQFLVQLISEICTTPPPVAIMPKPKKEKKNGSKPKQPKNEPRVSYLFNIFKNNSERSNKHCTVTSEALPLAYQDADHLPGRDGRDCDISGCNETWADPATTQLVCGHSVHKGCLQAGRKCPCAKFLEEKIWRLTEDYSCSILTSNVSDDLAEGERESGASDEALLANSSGINASIPADELERGLQRGANELEHLAAELQRRKEAGEPLLVPAQHA